ncbi:MAG: SIS domain-containing protein [Terracidiphilus sp.]
MTSNSEEDLLVNHFNQHLDAVVHSFEALHSQIVTTAGIIINALAFDKKLIAFGNGGSATQASHLAGELVGRFSKAPRRPLPAIALGADSGVVTCIGNDFGYESLFERQIAALVQSGDIAIGFTTSGKSNNVLRGLVMAAKKGAISIALTGAAGLEGGLAEHILQVSSTSTACIQEVHLMILHMWCFSIDAAFSNGNQRGTKSE